MFLSTSICLGIIEPFRTHNPLTLAGSTWALIDIGLFFPYTAGQAMYFFFFTIIISMAVGAGLCAGTIAAMGPFTPPSTTKAAIAISIATTEAVVVHLVRVKSPFWDLPGRIAQIWILVIPFSLYYPDASLSSSEVYAQCIVAPGYFAAGAAILLLVMTFVIPTLAGQYCRKAMQTLFFNIGSQTEAIIEVLAGPIHPATGQLLHAVQDAAETGVVEDERNVGIAGGLSQDIQDLYDLDQQIGRQFGKVCGFLTQSKWEVDAYHKPHLFPHSLYADMFWAGSQLGHFVMVMCDIIQPGRVPLRYIPPLLNPLKKVAVCMDDVSSLLGNILSERICFQDAMGLHAKLSAVDEPLRVLRLECFNLYDSLMQLSYQPPKESTNEDLVVAKLITETLFLASKELKVSYDLLKGQSAESAEKEESLLWPSTWASSIDGAVSDQYSTARWSNVDYKTVEVLPHTRGSIHLWLFQAAEVLHLRKHHFALLLQGAVAFSVSCLLVTIPAIGVDLLPNHGHWIITNVVFLTEVSAGSCIDRSWQRALGTFIAVGWTAIAYGVASLAGANSTYRTVGETAILCIFIVVGMTWMALVQSRMAPKAFYMWLVVMLNTPLLGISGSENISNYKTLGYGALAIILAVALATLPQLLLFPVTTKVWLNVHAVIGLKQVSRVAESSCKQLAFVQDAITREAWEEQNMQLRFTLGRMRDLQLLSGIEFFPFLFGERLKAGEIQQFMNRLRFHTVRWHVAILGQEELMRHGKWQPPGQDGVWAQYFVHMGAQEAAALRALRLVLREMATMEEAIGTVCALQDLVIDFAKAVGVDVAKAQGYSEACLLPEHKSPAVLCGLNAAFSGVLALRRLYRVTARMLLSQEDVVLVDSRLAQPVWWNSKTV